MLPNWEKGDVFLPYKHHPMGVLCWCFFLFVLFWGDSGSHEEKWTFLQRLHKTEHLSSSSARIGLTANATFGFEVLSLYPKVALIAKCPLLCFIKQQQCATATAITAFPATSFIAVGENTLLKPKGKSATFPFRHMARGEKGLITSNQSLPSQGGILLRTKQFTVCWTKIVHRRCSSGDSKITPAHLISQNQGERVQIMLRSIESQKQSQVGNTSWNYCLTPLAQRQPEDHYEGQYYNKFYLRESLKLKTTKL